MECLPISVRPTSLSPLLNTSLYAVNRPARLANWLSVLHIWRACSSNGRTEVDICSHGHDRLPEVHTWPGHLTPLSGLLLLLLVTLQTQSFPTTLAVFNSFLGGPTITRIFIRGPRYKGWVKSFSDSRLFNIRGVINLRDRTLCPELRALQFSKLSSASTVLRTNLWLPCLVLHGFLSGILFLGVVLQLSSILLFC